MSDFVPTQDQARALVALDSGANVFITGVAGTGKTAILRHWLDKKNFPAGAVAVTASTGIAASHLEGQTIHSWAGIGIGSKTVEEIGRSWFWRENIMPRIEAVKIIIIEEISMVDGHVFELLGEVIAVAKHSLKPWGDVQLVLLGDMGQLAPVEEQERGFAFETDQWWDLGIQTVELRQVMRQTDATFVAILQQVRDGTLSWESEAWLNTRVRAYDPDAYSAVRLMTHNDQVDAVNDAKLNALPEAPAFFEAFETGKQKWRDVLDNSCLSPRTLYLKRGARVMFTKNALDGSYVNGSLGFVLGFSTALSPEGAPFPTVHVHLDAGYDIALGACGIWKLEGVDDDPAERKRGASVTLASRRQFPLRLAWAITVHKSQGMSLDLVSVDLAHCFAPGQAYVALSRARTIQGLNIERWQGPKSIIAHPVVTRFCRGTYVLPSRQGLPPVAPPARAWTGGACSVCGQPQFKTPSGDTCANYHGGADSAPAEVECGSCDYGLPVNCVHVPPRARAGALPFDPAADF